MEVLPVVLTSVLVVLAIILAVVGVQVILVLSEIQKTLRRVNTTIDSAQQRLSSLVTPLQNLGGMAAGLQTGFKVFEAFVGWLSRNKDQSK
jgi:uncharacterized protein YoxC